MQSGRASSISTRPQTFRLAVGAIYASWRAKSWERVMTMGAGGYILAWIALPMFELATAGLIYRGVRPQLVRYAVVGVTSSAFIFNAQYYIGEILDRERGNGTLVALFLAPCPRLSWLTGFALGGVAESVLTAATTAAFGSWVFGVRFDPNLPALGLSLLLFLVSLGGLGFMFSAAGLALKRSNDLSNLVSPFLVLLGGVFYPVALLPSWLELPARCLPLGYGMEALYGASLHHASITTLAPQLLPLAGFAVALPIAGIAMFAWVERGVRRRGELELY